MQSNGFISFFLCDEVQCVATSGIKSQTVRNVLTCNPENYDVVVDILRHCDVCEHRCEGSHGQKISAADGAIRLRHAIGRDKCANLVGS